MQAPFVIDLRGCFEILVTLYFRIQNFFFDQPDTTLQLSLSTTISLLLLIYFIADEVDEKNKEKKKNLFRSSNTLLFFWIACVIVIEIIPITRDAYLFLSLFLFFFFSLPFQQWQPLLLT